MKLSETGAFIYSQHMHVAEMVEVKSKYLHTKTTKDA